MLTAAVGLITSPAQADEIIRNGRADMVMLAREELRDRTGRCVPPRSLRQPQHVPAQYLRAWDGAGVATCRVTVQRRGGRARRQRSRERPREVGMI